MYIYIYISISIFIYLLVYMYVYVHILLYFTTFLPLRNTYKLVPKGSVLSLDHVPIISEPEGVIIVKFQIVGLGSYYEHTDKKDPQCTETATFRSQVQGENSRNEPSRAEISRLQSGAQGAVRSLGKFCEAHGKVPESL